MNLRVRVEKLERRAPEVLIRFVATSPVEVLARGEKPTPGRFTFTLDYCEPDALPAEEES
jgi:hypothetical protein